MRNSIFIIPNEKKNVKLEELENGLRMYYTLACPKDFPNITFISKNKAWYQKTMVIPYGPNMSKRIDYAYNKLKTIVMCDLALHKMLFYTAKYNNLLQKRNLIKEYK
jgi:hypothetical protein